MFKKRVSATLPFQKYMQDTILADNAGVGGNGMDTLLVGDKVYIIAVPDESGAEQKPMPYINLPTIAEAKDRFAFQRVANDVAQVVDVHTAEKGTDVQMLKIVNRLIYLFDDEHPVIPGFRVTRMSIELTGTFPDMSGQSLRGILVARAHIQVA